ncbi:MULTISPECIES: hypothetical protein [Sphingomonas]|uniref:C2H2-type domain-containing protein n=1 Tax=Sphingomonas molluscorum TaxID=418184 RepID=A0ABU8Q7R8_9SPHN|nr:hypothetical protein [Sphingomonas sp. JUb134]MBM7407074.1 hypothetical protein [Sphingomonas sp. JUb134]
MGRVVVKSLWDFQRHGAHVRVRCGHYRCRHETIMRAAPLVRLFMERRWNADLTIAGSWFRCERCNHRGARLEMASPHLAPHLPPP